jgi:HEAT repeat protein
LGTIGPAAKPAAAALAEVRDHDQYPAIRDAAEVALHQIDLEGMAAASMGDASEEVQRLIRQLDSDDEYERVAAAEQLAEIGPEAVAAIPALAKALGHEDKWLRSAAAETLGTFGRQAEVVAPALRKAARDPEPEVAEKAKEALARVEGMSP